MGAGFTGALDARWPRVRRDYYGLWDPWRAQGSSPLGLHAFTPVEAGLCVVTMVVQRGVGRGVNRVDLPALEQALEVLRTRCGQGDEVHMPRIGTGLAGGRWDDIEKIVRRTLCDKGVPVTVYDLKTM